MGRLLARARLGICVALFPAVASAQGPSFDCGKAQGEVQTLICKDAGLAALDRQLDGVYKAAMTKARDGMPAQLRAEQRGWVKGRDDCWKAKGGPTYLTDSWQVSTVRDCVEGNYKIRISELQAQWQLVKSRPPVFYTCADNPANEVVATFFETDPPTARLERGDRTVIAWQITAASGSKYEGQNVTFWTKGNETTVTWLDEELRCKVR